MLHKHTKNTNICSQIDNVCESERGMWYIYFEARYISFKAGRSEKLHYADTVLHKAEEM